MTINPADSRTPAEQIASDLRQEIADGRLGPGEKLPSERVLSTRYNVSTTTVVRAIERLRDEGLVVTRPGAGRFVRVPKKLVRVGSDRFARSRRTAGKAAFQAEMEAAGLDWRQEILELAEVPADAEVAQWLSVSEGEPVWVRRRRTWADGAPTQLADSFYRLDDVAGTAIREEETGPGGSLARLEEKGYRVVRFREELWVRMPSHDEARELHLTGASPVVELHRIVSGEQGEVLEFFRSVMVGDRHVFGYEFDAPE